jgi:eukaryotic-like serine/threonine-protein kinase
MAKPAFKLIEKVFHDAVALPPEQRTPFLDAACSGDTDLRAAVEELLRHAGPDDLTLAGPVAAAAEHIRSQAPTVQRDAKAAIAAVSWPTIPGYDVLEELGRGGMGVVYQARQISLNRIVALKMLLPAHPDGNEMIARFRTEVEALARLQHPNIVTIYDIGVTGGRPYFAMEHIDGPSLARFMDSRPQDPLASARLIEMLARTMYAVHQHGIIHRDLKPANILLKGEDASASHSLASFVPKITDFGLAKDQTADGRLTATSVTMGTPSYMAPEQAGALAGVGPESDIYALGSILYELLIGRPPFEGQTPVDVVHQLLNDEPTSPLTIRPMLPADVVTICLKCLEKAPRNRFANALELAEELRRFQAGEPIHSRPVSALEHLVRWCRRRPLVAGLAAACSLLLVVLFVTALVYDSHLRAALAKVEAQSEQQRRQIVQLNVQIGITEIDRGNVCMAALRFTEALRLDDGHPEREREHRVRIANALQHCPRLVQLRVQDRQVLCTRLGVKEGWVATIASDHTVEVIDIITGQPVGPKLEIDERPTAGAISPDGGLLAVIANGGVTRICDLTTGKSQKLPCKGAQAIQRLAFCPEGRILFTQHADSAIRVWELTTKQLEAPSPLSAEVVVHAVLSDDARWLFTLDAKHVGQAWDLATGKATSKPFKVKQEVLLAAISSTGRRVALLGADKILQIWDLADGGLFGKAMPMQTSVDNLAFSPDANQLLTLSGKKTLAVWELRQDEWPSLYREAGRNIERGQWDADGRHIMMINESGAAQVMELATGRMMTRPPTHGGPLHSFAVRGRTLITVAKRGTLAIWELPKDDLPAKAAPAQPDTRPLAELLLLAQVLAGGRIDVGQEWEAFEAGPLQIAWDRWQSAR